MIFSEEGIESCTPPLSMEARAAKYNKNIHGINEVSNNESMSLNGNVTGSAIKIDRKNDTLLFDNSTFLLAFASDSSVVHCSIYTETNDDITNYSESSPLYLLMKSSGGDVYGD